MTISCQGCRDGTAFPMSFSMAFQPIVNIGSGEVFAHEALVRGANGEGARTVLEAVDASNKYAFDQQCRVKAIEIASRLELRKTPAMLSINFMPDAVYEPRACIRRTSHRRGALQPADGPDHLRVHRGRADRSHAHA